MKAFDKQKVMCENSHVLVAETTIPAPEHGETWMAHAFNSHRIIAREPAIFTGSIAKQYCDSPGMHPKRPAKMLSKKIMAKAIGVHGARSYPAPYCLPWSRN